MIKINNTDISDIRINDSSISKVMVRNTKVWPNSGPGPEDYIQNGLVFQLDGIDKGNNTGYWTDLIGGIGFLLHQNAVVNDNNVQFNNSPCVYDDNLTFTELNSYAGPWTIECCVYTNQYNSDFQFVIYPGKDAIGMICFQKNNNKYNIMVGGNSYHSPVMQFDQVLPNTILIDTINHIESSIITREFVINKDQYSANDHGGFQYNEYKTILGAQRADGSFPFNGKIYAIRIYNRMLTEEESLYNQQLDIERFNLDIPTRAEE